MKYFLLISLSLLALSCEYSEWRDPNNVTLTSVKKYAADEVKFISSSIKSPNDSLSLKQYDYDISPSSRLLIRLGSLRSIAKEVLDEQAILLRVTPHSSSDYTTAQQNLKLCPVTTNWMMYATWNEAHPYRQGQWQSVGGDYDSHECLEALPSTSDLLQNSDERSFCQDQNHLCFDIREHVKSYVRSRNLNNGWILISPHAIIAIAGDATSRGPEIFYRRFR